MSKFIDEITNSARTNRFSWSPIEVNAILGSFFYTYCATQLPGKFDNDVRFSNMVLRIAFPIPYQRISSLPHLSLNCSLIEVVSNLTLGIHSSPLLSRC